MLQGRVLCRISLFIILLIALSAHAPWDFLGVYDKALAAESILSDGDQVQACGYVYHKEIKKDKALYYVKNASVKSGSKYLSNTSFIFKSDSDFIPTFCKINSLTGNVNIFSVGRNEGSFDMKSYYNSMDLYFEITDVREISYSANLVEEYDFPYRIRQALNTVYMKCMPEDDAGFLSSVVLGDKSNLDLELKTLFQEVGISHILAVSGLHISVICMALYSFLRRRGVGFLFVGIISGSVAIGYGFLTGGSISSVRAIGMFLIYLGSQVAGESYDMLTALSVMADFLVLDKPMLVTNQSFIFSFAAVLGIFYVAIPLTSVYTKYSRERNRRFKSDEGFINVKLPLKYKLFDYLAKSFLFSFGMTVSMLPIVTQLFYQIPLYSVILNLIVLPLMPMLLGIGLMAGIIGVYCLPVAKVLLFLCHVVISVYEAVSTFFSQLPLASIIVGRRELLWVMLYYIFLLSAIRLMVFKGKVTKCIFVFMLIAGLWIIPRGSGDFEIDFLDVGQGDGIFINSGDGVCFFIDGGSTTQDEVGRYTMFPFLKYKGAGSIDYWFVTHMDLDHVSGVLELLEHGYRIDNIVLSAEIPPGETLDELLRLASLNGTNILYMNQGDVCGTENLSFTCVFPYSGMVSDDVNDLSLCLLMEHKRDSLIHWSSDDDIYKAFFGGDIAAEQEQAIAEAGLVGHVNLLKVSHHGSRFSSASSLLEVLSPDVAIISCAKVNRYGHPSAEAIERLEAAAGHIYYTMNSGRVRVDKAGVDEFINDY